MYILKKKLFEKIIIQKKSHKQNSNRTSSTNKIKMVRLKQRYILFDIIYPNVNSQEEPKNFNKTTTLTQLHSTSQNITLRTLSEIIKKQIKLLFGDQGTGLASLSLIVKYFSPKTSTGIIRCSRDHYKLVQASLTTIKKLNGKDVIVRVIKISGTIKKCEDSAIERNRRLVRELNMVSFQDDDIGKIVEDDIELDD